jgi:putative transcriptional regulator
MSKQTQQPFARQVRAWRERRKLSRVDASRELGVPLRTLEDWEYGKRTPRGIALRLLSARLRV